MSLDKKAMAFLCKKIDNVGNPEKVSRTVLNIENNIIF